MLETSTITIFQADYVAIDIEILIRGIPKDISGCTILFMVKDDIEDEDDDALIIKEIPPEEIIPGTDGKALLELTDEETDIPVKNGRIFGFKLVDTEDNPITFDTGVFNVKRSPVRGKALPEEPTP